MKITDLWPYFFGFGFIAALFFNIRGIVILALVLLASAFAGLVISGLAGEDKWPWLFGIALMASPIIGGIAAPGILLGWLAKLVVRKAIESERSGDDVG
jgi:hypothetical protein